MPNWGVVVREIQKERDDPGGDSAVDKVRKRHLQALHQHTKRNIICYYSGWLSKPKNLEGLEINDEDKNGFMLCTHQLDFRHGLDLFLHTPGGDGAATQSIVHYLKEIFGNDIRAFVPQIAMSAGTIMALACKSIVMGKHSNLGPVDPQINGIHAYAVLAEIERAYAEIIAENQRIWVWQPILQTYTGGFIQRCVWAKDKVKEMVTGYLEDNMLSSLPNGERETKAADIFNWLTELSANKGHDHHIHYEECKQKGLTIELLEDAKNKKLQDLVLTVHHCCMYSLSNSPAFKIIENHNGRRWLKIQQLMSTVQMMPAPIMIPPGSFTPSGPPH